MMFHDPLQALSKTLTVDELFYLKGQFSLLEPDRNGCITLDNIRMVGSSLSSDMLSNSFLSYSADSCLILIRP